MCLVRTPGRRYMGFPTSRKFRDASASPAQLETFFTRIPKKAKREHNGSITEAKKKPPRFGAAKRLLLVLAVRSTAQWQAAIIPAFALRNWFATRVAGFHICSIVWYNIRYQNYLLTRGVMTWLVYCNTGIMKKKRGFPTY